MGKDDRDSNLYFEIKYKYFEIKYKHFEIRYKHHY